MPDLTDQNVVNEEDELDEELDDEDVEVSWKNVDLLAFADAPTLRFFAENKFTYEEKIKFLEKQAEERLLERKKFKEELQKLGLTLNR